MKFISNFFKKKKIENTLSSSYQFRVEKKIGNATIVFDTHITDDEEDIWTVSFMNKADSSFALTYDNKAFEVFAFVRECLDSIIQKKAPCKFVFLACNDAGAGRRVRIYKKMIERYLAGQYEVIEETGSHSSRIWLVHV